ncbi:MAG: hypothetical protein D6826_00735, partial [Alphaproteobacteria bacterium]
EILDMGTEFTGPAEDALLSWLLRLEGDIAPAEAARVLLQRYGLADAPDPDGAAGELVRLLRETATCGSERLKRHFCRPRRPRRDRRRQRQRQRQRPQ